jgi:hypothetical protein
MKEAPTEKEMIFHSERCFRTSAEVWAVIRARHGDQLHVYSSFSDPSGERGAGPTGQGRMETTYALPGASWPLIGARTTWTIDPEGSTDRKDMKYEYFIFAPQAPESDT